MGLVCRDRGAARRVVPAAGNELTLEEGGHTGYKELGFWGTPAPFGALR